MMVRRGSLLLTLLLLLVSACAPAATQTGGTADTPKSDQPKKGGTLKIGIENFDPSLDPTIMGTQYTRHISNNIFNHLVDVDTNFKIIPELAKSWDVVDDKTVVLKLQTGVKFHDGTSFNAAAVKWNIEWTLNPDSKARKRSQLEDIKEVQVVDDSTVRLILTKPSAALMVNLADTTGFMMSPTAFQKGGTAAFGINPVGTGPFKFVSMDPNDNVVIERNNEYWEPGFPYLDKIIVYKIPDQTVRLNALRSGNIDMIDFVPPQEVAALKADKNYVFSELPGTIRDGMSFNVGKAPFNDARLRRAVAYAIDPEPIRKTVFFDTLVATRGYQPPSIWSFNKNFKGLPYDPAKAKEELAKAGKPNGFKFQLKGANRLLEQAEAEIIKAQLAKVGIEVELALADSVKYIADTNNCDFEAGVGPVSQRADPDSGVFEAFHSKGSTNRCGYANPQVDKLLEDARVIYDTSKRTPMYQEIERLVIEEDAFLNLFGHRAEIKVYPKKVKGFTHHPDYVIRTKNIWLDQ